MLFFVKDSIKCKQIEWSRDYDLECIGLQLILSVQMSFTVIGIYRPPGAKSVFFEELNTLVKECNSKKEIMLLGDFNINWLDKVKRKVLKGMANVFDFQQVIEGPSRITATSETLIDLVFTNRPDRIKKSYNLVTGLSDHNMILINRKLNKSRFSGSSCKKTEHYKIPHNKLDHLKKAIEEVNWNDLFSDQCMENNVQSFMTKLSSVMHGFMRKVKPRPGKNPHLPWLNDELRSLMKQRTWL